MNFSLIWFGLFYTFIGAMFEAQARRSNPKHFLQLHNKNRKSYNPEQDSDCFCFGRQPLHKYVHQKLMTDGHGLDRLVVYFYKDTVTQEVLMYTPSATRQFLIPDLAFEENDDLSMATDRRVSDIFNNNLNVIQIIKETKSEDQNGNILPEPDSQSEEIEPVISVSDDQNDNGKILPEPDNQSHEIEPVIPDDGNDNGNILPEPDDQSYEMKPVQLPDDGNDQPLPNDDQADNDDVIPIAIPDFDEDNSNENYVYKPDNEAYITFAKWVSQQLKRVKLGLLHSDSIAVLKVLLEKILRANGMYVSKDGLLRDENGYITNLNNLQLRPILIGGSVRYDKLLSLDNAASFSENVSYLEAVLISLINPSKILGIAPLKQVHLPRGLKWNSQNILDYVSKDLGKPCNKPNCYGPYLGSSVASDQVKIQKQVIYSNGNRREESSHQEIVTDGVSKETMGFIQKTKDQLFKDQLLEQSKKNSSIEQSSVKKEGVDEGQTGDKSAQESDKQEDIIFPTIASIEITEKKDEIDLLPVAAVQISDKDGSAGVPKESYKVQDSGKLGGLLFPPVISLQGTYTGQESNKNKGIGIANSLNLSIDKQSANKSSRKQSKLGYRVRNLINELSTIILKNKDSDEASLEEETPGYRIIGGSAATGSGLPLSVKGRRSGWRH